MIVRRSFTPTTVFIALTLLSGISAERWSRQVSNSDWIPLANPRAGQVPQSNDRSGLLSTSTHLPNPIESLALPPALQQQYQDQLIQLQKTQESIQKLLLLQQQLKAQQQLLQSQTFLPSGFGNADDERQTPSSVASNLQTAPELAPELLLPQQPSSEALPQIYSSQSFHKQGQIRQPVQGQVLLQGEDVTLEDPRAYISKQSSPRPGGKRLKGQLSPELPQSSLIENVGNEEEEVQLVYVPAETLAQRGQPKRGHGRKQYLVRPQQQESQGIIEQTSLSPDQEAFARQVLQQIQKEHEEKAQFLKDERVKEFARLNEEQKALERKTRLQQEALQREQELLRQKEAEKKRKELERLEEMARQRELERIREAREKQRQEELERRRLAELRAKEEKRREEEARQREERQKQAALEQQRILQQDDQSRVGNPSLLQQNAQSQALIREQARRTQLADANRPKKIRGRQRQRVNQYQEQSSYHEVTTTPSPNQPPLSVYMGGPSSKLETVKVTDVLRILRDAKTIAVLDNVTPNSPQVFVGPSNLDPPYGYAKFDLPYLSSIDHNRVERKVDKLPFFVAPLSFEPPPGYSKIPFPAPHIGSVVVNTLSSEPDVTATEQNPNPVPLIEPNSYSDADHSSSVATTASYESTTAQNFPVESSGQKYESAYSTSPPSASRFRFRQFYDNKPTSMISTLYYGEQSATKTKPKHYYEQESKLTTQSPSFQDGTVGSHDPSTKEQDLAAQLALINQELAQQREAQRYTTAEQYNSQANLGEAYDVNDVRAPVGPTQYNLPAELPPISPHLPGLVNSLLDKHERNLLSTSTPPTTVTTTTTPTTTTTARVSSTTYRPRGRSRIVPTRARTTQAPSSRTNTDRSRRPYSRSKSRFSTTTTEYYHESSYEPTKAKTPETTQKYKTTEHRRPTTRTNKYRSRDRTSSQSAVHEQNRNAQTHQATVYENYPTQSDSSQGSPDAYSPASGPASNFHPKEVPPTGGLSDLTRENYPPTAPTQTENYPPLSEVTKVQHGIPSVSDEYSRNQNYPQNRAQEVRHHGTTYGDQNSDYLEQLEKAPVNGFNYQVGNEESPDRTVPQRLGEYSRYQDKTENANYNLASTEDPRVVRPGEEHRYSAIYEMNVAQAQPDYNTGGQGPPFRNIADGKIESSVIDADPSAPPIFVPLQNEKQEDYELQTQTPLIEITTTSTTTPAPVIIRQRVRGRLGGNSRTHHDSAIQTRPRGNQDEYVRFSAVNHDSSRTSHRIRDGTRTRTRARPQSHGSQVQTEGNEYIKIHAAQQQRLVATTIPPTTTTVATTTVSPVEEDVDYGFIRQPSFQAVHPVDNRFQAPITYRPPLSEIQHILSNDETAVESNPAHFLKNRPKYHQTPSRRPPATKIFTTATTSTTTEVASAVTTMPDDDVYMTKIKPRTEEPKSTKVRGRIRRPGKKRPTTTTESGPEANELPLDENYPRITPQQLSTTAVGQQPLYDDNFDVSPQFVPNQDRQAQVYEETGENYPPQEFILNFGELSGQLPQREEYDQTQLASTSSKKYISNLMTNKGARTTGDIYGSESQWSTKLSKTSFQPSFSANRATEETKENRHRSNNNQNNRNAPEIITAGPEVPAVTMVVSSDYQKYPDVSMNTDVFGRKTKEDHTGKLNATTTVMKSPAVSEDKIQSHQEPSMETWEWTSNKEKISSEQTNDDGKVTKITDPSVIGRKGGTRRRRVRVRVRPAMDDFVTAESQHYSSALNSLLQEEYKYNPIRESKFTTVQPIATTVTATTTTGAQTTKKSMLQDFLEEILKNSEIPAPTSLTSVTTEVPEWTMSTPMTTPYIAADNDVVTTLKESETPTVMTLMRDADNERFGITNESAISAKNNSEQTTLPTLERTSQLTREEIKERNADSQEDRIEHNNLENIEMLTQRYKLPLKYPDGSDVTRNIEETIAKLTGLPEEIQKLSVVDKKKEHIMTLKRQEESTERNEAHPKNHRAKWSEVRYPSTFDKSSSKQHSTTSIPGVTTRNKGETSVKTLSDYVAAIFDSMKSAEEEEEVAKVIETKNKTLADNSYELENAAAVHEALSAKQVEKTEQKAVATDSPRDTFTTQHVRSEENLSGLHDVTEVTTTKEITTTFETTTLMPDTTASMEVSSEEVATTEPVTTIATTTGQTAIKTSNTETMLGKVLRTSTTTKVSHMTEICYRGRCVMTKPRMEDATR